MNSSNKSFGIVFFVFLTIIGIFPYFQGGAINKLLIFFGFVFLILGLLNSKFLTPLNKIWIKFGILLGKIVSPIVMILIYFSIITLTKIFLILFKKDILNLKIDKKINSYWIDREDDEYNMSNQF